jgi:hypothetical protein
MKILSRASNLRGSLSDERKRLIASYLKNPEPTTDDWEAVAHMVINPGRLVTVWKAVCAIDPTFQRKIENNTEKRWNRAPDGFTVARAIQAALHKA